MSFDIFILDKAFPPTHSFVDGVICSSGLRSSRKVLLFLERNESRRMRYRGAYCLSPFPRRRGFGRVQWFLASAYLFWRLGRAHRKGRSQWSGNVFVRNDPFSLWAAAEAKRFGCVRTLVYQSSFPHELSKGSTIAAILAVFFKYAFRKVDHTYTVSNVSAHRLEGYGASEVRVVPLYVQDDFFRAPIAKPSRPSRFVYIGTALKPRLIDYVIASFLVAQKTKPGITFDLIGTEPVERDRIAQSLGGIARLESRGVRFLERLERSLIPETLQQYDAGVSCIPVTPKYLELSPTKTGEYMAVGLPVLAVRGIPMQDELLEGSKGGVLCEDFSHESMAEGFIALSKSEVAARVGTKAFAYAQTHLRYHAAVARLIDDFR